MQCPQAYAYHYIERLRPTLSPAALLFGSALDAAFNELLKPVKNILPEDIFIQEFSTAVINNKKVDVKSNINLTYASADLDFDLLSLSEEEQGRLTFLKNKKSKFGLYSFTEDEHLFFNAYNWYSLREKGLLMIKAYKEKVLPLITKVHDVQIPIELSNGEDSIIGYVDLVAEVEGHGLVVLDNKTSSIEYASDSVVVSPQLSLYLHSLQAKYPTRKAGYIVLRKQVKKNKIKVCSTCHHDGSATRHATCPSVVDKKRCGGEWIETIDPEIDIQIIIDEIPTRTEEIVLDNYDAITSMIKNKIFTRNLSTCGNIYGAKCVYYGKCYKNSCTGLEEV
jgi:hypothetical protein